MTRTPKFVGGEEAFFVRTSAFSSFGEEQAEGRLTGLVTPLTFESKSTLDNDESSMRVDSKKLDVKLGIPQVGHCLVTVSRNLVLRY